MENAKTLGVWTDGGARGNPGPAGIGVQIAEVEPETGEVKVVLTEIAEYIGETTNNQAEYRALLAALERLEHDNMSQHANQITFYTDSELMAYQIQGKYKVKNEELRVLYDRIIEKLAQLTNWQIMPVRREKNQSADRLVNAAIDAAQVSN